jgi:hypothetical protein
MLIGQGEIRPRLGNSLIAMGSLTTSPKRKQSLLMCIDHATQITTTLLLIWSFYTPRPLEV